MAGINERHFLCVPPSKLRPGFAFIVAVRAVSAALAVVLGFPECRKQSGNEPVTAACYPVFADSWQTASKVHLLKRV